MWLLEVSIEVRKTHAYKLQNKSVYKTAIKKKRKQKT